MKVWLLIIFTYSGWNSQLEKTTPVGVFYDHDRCIEQAKSFGTFADKPQAICIEQIGATQ